MCSLSLLYGVIMEDNLLKTGLWALVPKNVDGNCSHYGIYLKYQVDLLKGDKISETEFNKIDEPDNKFVEIFERIIHNDEDNIPKFIFGKQPFLTYEPVQKIMIQEHFVYDDVNAVARATELKWEKIREKRDILLKNSDLESGITFTDRFNAKPETFRNSWLQYRQQLRDIPQNFSDPWEIVWPEKPI